MSLPALIAKSSFLFTRTKAGQFYFVRLALALICTGCETRLYSAVSRNLDRRIGALFLLTILFSPGLFHASSAMLPSSFAMYTSMLGLAAFLDQKGRVNTARGIMWFGVGAIVGWPFAGALVLPFLLDEAIAGVRDGTTNLAVSRIVRGVIKCLVVLVGLNLRILLGCSYFLLSIQSVEVAVDSAFYRKLVVVPWNIVAYNVFGGAGRGPDIFGTEPWTFYIRNLLLNFNVWFILALASGPLLILQALFGSQKTSKETLLRSITFVLPFYMWLGIFTIQPHKEERFMYPAYPFLALNAAIALHLVLAYLGSSNPKQLIGRVPLKAKFLAIAVTVLCAVNIGLLRTAGIVTAYSAPLQVSRKLEEPGLAQSGDTVCLGKEWYRFPSSFFLPDNLRAKFVKSEFDGLLPGEFMESNDDHGLYPGTWMIPSGMNDRNEEDPGKHVSGILDFHHRMIADFPDRYF